MGEFEVAIGELIKTHPSVGWVRGDLVPDVPAAEEILRLRHKIEELEGRLAAARTQAPEGTASLAQGNDIFAVEHKFQSHAPGKIIPSTNYTHSVNITWNDIFAAVSPLMINEASEHAFRGALNDVVEARGRQALKKDKDLKGMVVRNFKLSEDDFQTIKVQLRALGLIAKSSKQRSVKDTQAYWTLTPFGDAAMTRLRAIEREAPDPGHI